jgi:hypothetical protein
MANKIKPRRSYTASSVPLTSDLDTHELAINWVDGKAFTKDAAGNIVSVTLGGGSYTLPTASSSTLGGVRVGSGLSISSGVLSASDSRWDLFLPPAPTSVTGTPGNSRATVSWTAPTVLAQTPINDYTLQYSSNSGSSWTTFTRSASAATSVTVTGLTNGTAYTFRVSATNAVGTGSYSTASSAMTPATDSLFSSVTLLLHMDGTGSTFVDSSSTPLSITANGDATQSVTQSKFGGKSAYFDGTGDYLSVAASQGFEFGTGDFVVEFWVRPESTFNPGGGRYTTWLSLNQYTNGLMVRPTLTGNGIQVFVGGTMYSYSTSLSLGTWYYVAISRASGTVRIYVNGTQLGSDQSNSYNFTSNSTNTIGTAAHGLTESMAGYIDEFRVTKGSARSYTGATVTVPTAAFPDS